MWNSTSDAQSTVYSMYHVVNDTSDLNHRRHHIEILGRRVSVGPQSPGAQHHRASRAPHGSTDR